MPPLKHACCTCPRHRPYPWRRPSQRRAGTAMDASDRSEDAGLAVGRGSVVEQGVESDMVVRDWAAGDFLVESSSTSMSEDAVRSSPTASIESSTTRAELDSGSGSDERTAATGMDSDDGGQGQSAVPGDSNLSLHLGGRQNDDDELDRDEICAQAGERDTPNEQTSGEFMDSDIDNGDDDPEDETIPVTLDEVLPTINALGYASIDDFLEDVLEEVDSSSSADNEAYVQEYVDLRYASEDEHHDFGTIVTLPFLPVSDVNGGPPAAKSVLENLPSCVLQEEDAAGIDPAPCAICQDDMLPEESGRMLPCHHRYHEECILQWLRSRNTCPICRFELPTDDPEYERQKAMRAR